MKILKKYFGLFENTIPLSKFNNKMATDSHIDIRLPLEQILRQKIAYHESQIGYHQEQIEALKNSLSANGFDLLSGSYSMETSIKYAKPSQKGIKPMVLNWLKEEAEDGLIGALTTNDIYDKLKALYTISEDDRKEWIAIISQTFNSLAKSDLIEVKPIPSRKGNYYSLKEESSPLQNELL